MENKNDKLQIIIENFSRLEKDEQLKVAIRIDSIWDKAYTEYIEMCSQDKELCEIFDKLKQINQILSFDLADHYYKLVETINDHDPEFADYIHEFDSEAFKKAKNVSENLKEQTDLLQTNIDELNKQLQQAKDELQKIENQSVLFKRIRIASIKARIELIEKEIIGVKNKIQSKENTAKHFKECMQKQAQKENYQKNFDTLVAPLKKKYEETTKMYAEKVVGKFIETDPIILCVEHNTTKSGGENRDFDSEILNKVCNSKRYNVMFTMKDMGFEK